MQLATFVSPVSLSRNSRFPLGFVAILLAALATGCGGNRMASPVGPTPQNTTVTVLVSSTANDQLVQMNVGFNTLSLTSQSGTTVNLFNSPNSVLAAEFIHLNGTAEPLLTVSVPQGTYTSASATVQYAQVSCVMLEPNNGGLLSDEFQSGTPPVVTMTLPAPIRVTGTAMGLVLNLQVSQSVMPANCPLTQGNPTINTAFTVTPVTLTGQPTSVQNGKLSSLQGLISAVNSMANSFTVTASDGPTWTARSDNNTAYQGVAAFSTLAAGMPVDFDVALQSDGSLLATRVEVPDANPSSLTVAGGPALFVNTQFSDVLSYALESQGFLFPGHAFGGWYYSFGNSTFQITGRFSNLQSLPFAPSFTGTSLFPGQNAFVTSHAQTIAPEPTYIAASTLTLMPQTINGIVTATGNEGSFTTYTVSLASYDLLPQLAVQPGQTTSLNNPSTVVVYVDSNTQLLNTKQLAIGTVFRFNGLLFNDNGTLRLDAAQINDGVLE